MPYTLKSENMLRNVKKTTDLMASSHVSPAPLLSLCQMGTMVLHKHKGACFFKSIKLKNRWDGI